MLLKSLQACPTLCNPMDSSPQGSSVLGILQARILEWFAISFSNACMHANSLQSCPTLCDPMDSSPQGSSVLGILQERILEWFATSYYIKLKGFCMVKEIIDKRKKKKRKAAYRMGEDICKREIQSGFNVQNIHDLIQFDIKKKEMLLKMCRVTSLVTQWIRIRLPAQGTQVWSVVHEDPTRCEAAKPESHNSQARPLKLLSLCPTTTEAWMPRARALQEKLLQWEGLHWNEK